MNQNRTQKKGFTLIEVMIVVGVIALLTTILALGGRAVTKSVKLSATKTTFQNILSLQAEYEASTGKLPDTVIVNSVTQYVRADELSTEDIDALPTSTNSRDFHGMYTQRVMRYLNRNPKVKATLNKLPANALAVVDILWVAPPATYGDVTQMYYMSPLLGFHYLRGDVVKWSSANSGNDHYFVCVREHLNISPSGIIITPGTNFVPQGTPVTPSTCWVDLGTLNTKKVFVPIDGWGNGLRFVGSAGLDRLKVDVKGALNWIGPDPLDIPEQPYALQAMPTITPPWNWIKRKLVSPSYTTYWVSAGPDGDFKTQDDNLYSYEN